MSHWIEQLGAWALDAQPGEQAHVTDRTTGAAYTVTVGEHIQPDRSDARIYVPHEHAWVYHQTLCSPTITAHCACGATATVEDSDQEDTMPTTHRIDEARQRRDRHIAELLGLDPDQTANIDVERAPVEQNRPSIAERMRIEPAYRPEPKPERVTWIHAGDGPWPEHSHERLEARAHPVLGWDREHLHAETWAAIIAADDEYAATFTEERR
ncbi:hypothetical protein [Isoptericola sp. NPDC056605]|uniref:hypothetical protein n=1 Tax=Isoptericola sp. NPDC056605 TaxID=3345876 RepID=UPI0036A51285